MRMATRRGTRAIRITTTLTALTCVVLATSAAIALGRTKSCAQISNCTTAVAVIPPPTATLGGKPTPASRYGVAVKTAPAQTLGARRQSGKLVAAAKFGRHVRCPGYQLKAPNTIQFQLLTATPVNITYAITDRITNTTAQGIHFCLAANFAFKTLSGRPARAVRLPDGTRGHVGLLPACPRPLPPAGATTAPCVQGVRTVKDAQSSTGVDVILRVRVPTRTKGDPWGGS
jgi:hypothetical protein